MTKQTNCNYRTPYKPQVEYYDEQMVIIGGVKYQRVEEPKPQTLYDALCEKGNMYSSVCDTVIEIVDEWLFTEDDGDDRYACGWNDCLEKLRLRLK